jgi:hypothetical protein
MSGIFGRKNPQEQAQLEQTRQVVAGQHEPMVRAALEQLTTWAFPGSQVESAGTGTWQLVHTSASGEKIVDVTVTLEFKKDRPVALTTDHYRDGFGRSSGTLTLDRESLDDALRRCLCGRR